MKKKYIVPALEIVEIDPESIIAATVHSDGNGINLTGACSESDAVNAAAKTNKSIWDFE